MLYSIVPCKTPMREKITTPSLDEERESVSWEYAKSPVSRAMTVLSKALHGLLFELHKKLLTRV